MPQITFTEDDKYKLLFIDIPELINEQSFYEISIARITNGLNKVHDYKTLVNSPSALRLRQLINNRPFNFMKPYKYLRTFIYRFPEKD